MNALADAYRTQDLARFEQLISFAPGARFSFHLVDSLADGTTHWDPESEVHVHRRMFETVRPAGAAPVRRLDDWPAPPYMRLAGITMSLAPIAPFAEVANPPELDPERWRAFVATYDVRILFSTHDSIDYLVSEPVEFGVIEDLAKSALDSGKFLLYSSRELPVESMVPDRLPEPTGVEPVLWGQFKALYALQSTPAALVEVLEDAYRRRDYEDFTELFPEEGDDVPYLFILNDPPLGTPPYWDQAEEVRIHRRMFEPESTLPGEIPVPPEIWLASITITLTPNANFAERLDLYRSPANPNGLDRERWRVFEAQYHANIYFDTQTDTDYRVSGEENFVVVDRRDRLDGVPGNYVLFRWEDLGSWSRIASSSSTWSDVKSLYR